MIVNPTNLIEFIMRESIKPKKRMTPRDYLNLFEKEDADRRRQDTMRRKQAEQKENEDE